MTLVTPSVLVIARSAVSVTVSVSDAVLLPGAGSVTPAGAAIVATLVRVPVAPPATVAFTVNVTLPDAGNVGTTMPLPCISATVVLGGVGHAAPAEALPQVTPVAVRLAMAGSLKIAAFAPEGPALLTTIVYTSSRRH